MKNEHAEGGSIADWQLERYRLDELPAEEKEAVRRALEDDPRLRERLAELSRSSQEILARHPPRVMAAAIRMRLAASRRAAVSSPLAWAAAALVVVAGSVALLRQPRTPGPVPQDETRVKGLATRLLVYRQGAAAPEALASGSAVRARDVVQLAYQVGDKRYGTIVSVDGRGVVTRHLPKNGAHAVALSPGAPVPLGEAYELDDAPRFERFHLVTSPQPFALPAILVAAASRPLAGDRLNLAPSFEQSTVVLTKEDAR